MSTKTLPLVHTFRTAQTDLHKDSAAFRVHNNCSDYFFFQGELYRSIFISITSQAQYLRSHTSFI